VGISNLNRIFEPESIAVVGASEKEGSIGWALMRNLIEGGYPGTVIPVNPNHRSIFGKEAVPNVTDIGFSVDMALIASPISTVPDVIDACVTAGVKGAVIISAGGKEIGQKGEALEGKIWENARKGNLRIVGPNCVGIIIPSLNLNASFSSGMPKSGNLAFISQSGALCAAILDAAIQENFGFSHFISIGSMLDVDFGDCIDYLGNDPKVKSILLYIESLTHFRKFMSAARAVSRVKPIVALKSGRSAAGARAAASHTGAMAGEDVVYDAAFKRAGIVRVDTFEELFDCAELMAKQARPRSSDLVIITNGGGPGVMAADALARYGIEPASMSTETLKALDDVLPPLWSRNNPIDMIGDATADCYEKTLKICLKEERPGGILVIMVPLALSDPADVAKKVATSLSDKMVPVFTSWMGGKVVQKGIEILNQAGIPTYDTPEKAVRAFLYMVAYSRNLETLMEIPPRFLKKISCDKDRAAGLIAAALNGPCPTLTEDASKAVLEAYGIRVNPVQFALSESEAVSRAERLGYPLAMKLISPDITHKTEADGVHLDLNSPEEIRKSYHRIMQGAKAYNPDARVMGVSLQPYIERPDYELLIGAKRDENFGPVILFGLGGIFTEILKDCAIGLPPLNRLLARRLMEETRAYRLLQGYRNRPPADMALLEEMLVRLAQLVMDFPDIAELDMNPVAVKDGIPCALDARLVLKRSTKPSPMHLVISPYPQDQEASITTRTGISLFIRPIIPEDAPLLEVLFYRLSPNTIYYRFFHHMKTITPEMLERLTQIDYDKEIALVALEKNEKEERILGVARIISHPDGKQAEFAIVIADPWQGKGIGAVLLEHALRIAKGRSIETVWGGVLQENIHMQRLGKKMGFAMKYNRESGVYDLTIDLNSTTL